MTGPFNSVPEPYDCVDDAFGAEHCDVCGEPLEEGDEAYYIGIRTICRRCEEAAKEAIFEEVGHKYLSEVYYG